MEQVEEKINFAESMKNLFLHLPLSLKGNLFETTILYALCVRACVHACFLSMSEPVD
jgi:hypothetical protein